MSTTYSSVSLSKNRKESFGKAPIMKVDFCTSIPIDTVLTDKPEIFFRKLESFSEGSGKNLQAAGAIEEVAANTREMTRVEERRGEQWRWMVAMKMSYAPLVVAETALTRSRGNPLGWVIIRRKKSSAYEERPQSQGSADRRSIVRPTLISSMRLFIGHSAT